MLTSPMDAPGIYLVEANQICRDTQSLRREYLPGTQVGSWQEELAHKLSISLISRGTAEENRVKSSEHGLTSVLLQEDWEVSVSCDSPEANKALGLQSPVLSDPQFGGG